MTQTFRYLDRDDAIRLAVTDTLAPEQVESAEAFEKSIAELRDQINSTRAQIARLEGELDSLAQTK
ncbi:MAG: hypothetical protein ABSG84_12175 [Acidobacteriaceae bacterium]|jgi:Arc/MetJ-type ribon-helix-helix transcriptional regulator